MKKHIVQSVYALLAILLLTGATTPPALAENVKFVYAYNGSGTLLLPNNAAEQCPDPAADTSAATTCHGVKVDSKGEYSLSLTAGTFDTSNLVLVANEYQLIPAGSKDLTVDTYILLDTKRRIDNIEKETTNDGVDINRVSEATVKAVEKVKNVPKGKKGKVDKELASVAKDLDTDAINTSMGNSKSDNKPTDEYKQHEHGVITAEQAQLNDEEEELLVSMATLALENEDNPSTQTYIRKNVIQALVDPATLEEISTRVYSHVSEIQAGTSDETVMLLEADRYMVYLNELAQLSTANSRNPSQFFAYTWKGVDSETTTASFKKSEKGSYLVCVTGEIDNANDSSTDCIRIAVKNVVDAIARASSQRIGTGNTLSLSASLSVGAESYSWSGPGNFANATSSDAVWTAPDEPGRYEITLAINNGEDTDTLSVDVFDVLPLAVAEADQYVTYLANNSATVSLLSGSISTDGSAVDSITWSISQSPEGSTASIANNQAAITQFSTSTPGNYTLQLTATKRDATHSAEITLQIRQTDAPFADAGPDQVTFRNEAVKLDGTGSYASQGLALSYQWSSTTGTLASPTNASTQFSAAEIGEYQVTLDVSDGNQSVADTVAISVRNHLPSASDDVVANLLNEIITGELLAIDRDRDILTYTLISEPQLGGITLDETTGAYTYLPGGVKGCQYKPYARPSDNDKGGKDVPVIKLCADKFVAAPGEVITLTTSNSINASKFSGYTWLGGAVGDPDDIRLATFTSTEPGFHQICITGNIGQSKNTSTACLEVLISGSGETIDHNVQTGYVDYFTYRVSDSLGLSNIATVRITIGWENSAPVVADASISTPEDTPVSGSLNPSDEDQHDITLRIDSNGTLGTAVLTNASTGKYTYTPNPNAFGVDTFTVIANDGLEDSVPATITVTIINTNDAPVAHYAGILTTPEDTATNGTLGATDPDGDVLDFRLATIPDKGDVTITNTTTGAFTYTPHDNKNGEDSFYFVAHDSEFESNVAKVNINILPENDAPTADNQGPLTTHTDEVLEGELLATDVDKDALIYKVVSNPSKGTVNLNASTGSFSFTSNGTDLGEDSFTFTASDAYTTSNIATVSLNILVANMAPVANPQSISVYESVTYGGQLSGSDADGGTLSFAIAENGRLGTAIITNASDGSFTYVSKPGSSGEDYFTFTVNDGDKTSTAVKVQVNVLDSALVCQGPGNEKRDSDGDGYADIVEIAFGTAIDNASDTPAGLDPVAYNVSFADDDDNDNFTDINELWLSTNHLSDASIPTLSTLYGVPLCLSALFDTQAPALFAFSILTPIVDMDSGDDKARFALTTLDNAAGVKLVEITLTSPSGSTIEGSVTVENSTPVLYTEFATDTFNKYAEAGIWTVSELKITDAAGSSLSLDTAYLTALDYPTTVTLINANSDPDKPSLLNFEILTPTVDVSGATPYASYRFQVTDSPAGVARMAATLQSPSGSQFRIGEKTLATENQTSVDEQIDSESFDVYSELGTWTVTSVTISDHAGNVLQLETADLTTSGFATTLTVINSNPPAIPDTEPPALTDLQILTPIIDLNLTDKTAKFSVSATDNESGVREIVMTLQRQSSSSETMTVTHSILGGPTEVTTTVNSNDFSSNSLCSAWVVASIRLSDVAGNEATWSTEQLTELDYSTVFGFKNSGWNYICQVNHRPYAYSDSFETDEDVAFSDKLQAVDADNDPLTYLIATKPLHGSVVIDDAATGAFTYTPTANYHGTDSFTFKVDDGYVESDAATIAIVVKPVADDTLVEDLSIIVTENVAYFGTLDATDDDNETLTFSIVDNGSLGTASFLDANTGRFQYTPNPDTTGSDSFTFQVSDSNSTSRVTTVSVEIYPELTLIDFNVLTPVVSGKNRLVPISCDVTISKDIAALTEALINIQGPSGQETTLRAEIRESAYPFVILNKIHTPDFPLEAGTWTFKDLLVKKLGEDLFKTVTNDIAALGFSNTFEVRDNTAPVASTEETLVTSLSTPKQDTLVATDAENDALTYRIETNGSLGNVTLVDASTGEYLYTPHTLDQETDTDSFTFIANDGLDDSNLGLVTVTLNRDPQAPVSNDATIRVTANIAYQGTLVASDLDTETLTYSIVAAPQQGILTLSNDQTGEFVYRPNADASADKDVDDTFTFKVNDGLSDSNTATVSVNIVNTPVAYSDSITAFENTVYNGTLRAADPDGDSLTYELITNGLLGTVSLNSSTGSYTYTPETDVLGSDVFSFRVTDGVNTSDTATISVNIISAEQACGTGGAVAGLDTDGDGYVDTLEAMFNTAIDDPLDSPAGLNAADLGIVYNDDDDSDSHKDFVEIWLDADPADENSQPENVLDACFDPISDGIKPRLIGFDIVTPTRDIAAGDTTIRYAMTLLDNASGIKRIRLSLVSPTGVFVTTSLSFESHPILTGTLMDNDPLSEFAEPGTWTINSITLFDEAGNRLNLSTTDLSDAGFDTEIEVSNTNSDTTAPTLDNFTIQSTYVYPGTDNDRMKVALELSDDSSGISSARVDFISATGTIVSASQTLAENPTSTTINLDTGRLSQHLEEGIWTVYGVLLVDAAGNSVQLADQLSTLGFDTTLQVTNPLSDTTAPTFSALSILTDEIYPANGDARMRFAVTVADNAGIERIRIDITGPSGQIIYAWGNYESNYPLSAIAEVNTSTLSSLLEEGTWTINALEIFDDAGNSTLLDSNDLVNQGYPVTVEVKY